MSEPSAGPDLPFRFSRFVIVTGPDVGRDIVMPDKRVLCHQTVSKTGDPWRRPEVFGIASQ